MIIDYHPTSCWTFERLHQPQLYRNLCSIIKYDLSGFLLMSLALC